MSSVTITSNTRLFKVFQDIDGVLHLQRTGMYLPSGINCVLDQSSTAFYDHREQPARLVKSVDEEEVCAQQLYVLEDELQFVEIVV